jgi:hypothetical protein
LEKFTRSVSVFVGTERSYADRRTNLVTAIGGSLNLLALRFHFLGFAFAAEFA